MVQLTLGVDIDHFENHWSRLSFRSHSWFQGLMKVVKQDKTTAVDLKGFTTVLLRVCHTKIFKRGIDYYEIDEITQSIFLMWR